MILVVGATGMVGGEICRRLAAAGTPVRALVRPTSDAGKVAALHQHGVQVVIGDLRDRNSLRDACLGVTSVVTTVSSMPFGYVPGVNDIETTDRRGVLDLVDAARGAGVRRFVYTSFSGNLDRDFPLRDAKREVERSLAASGMTYTILRPSCFMELWLSPMVGFEPLEGRVVVYGAGESPVSWISIADVAAFAVASLTESMAQDTVLELGGPRPIPALEVVRLFEAALGRPLAVTHVPVEALDAAVATAADPMQRSFAALQRCVADGDAIEMGRTVDLVAEPLATVEEYALRMVPMTAGA